MHQLTSQQVATGQTIADAITGARDLDTLREMLNLFWDFATLVAPDEQTELAKSFGLDFSNLATFGPEPSADDDGWSWDRHRLLTFDAMASEPWLLRWRSDLADNKIRDIFREYFRSLNKPFRHKKDDSVEYKDNDMWLLFARTSQDAIARLGWMA